ncbi:hypothetical protein PG984_002861 [Apiospora sp. TS-2023a]
MYSLSLAQKKTRRHSLYVRRNGSPPTTTSCRFLVVLRVRVHYGCDFDALSLALEIRRPEKTPPNPSLPKSIVLGGRFICIIVDRWHVVAGPPALASSLP